MESSLHEVEAIKLMLERVAEEVEYLNPMLLVEISI